ncbi:HD domain-containing protein [Candidatus Peregrinibacteria bacterium]|nr:HD domain-containing protein [Candidatus Peregrinibacteria bacterium]
MNEKDVEKLYREFHTPPHVRAHCKAVADFAVDLGKKFIAAGQRIDLKMLRNAALVHDLLRVVDFRHFEPRKWEYKVSDEDIKCWERLREKYKGMHHGDATAEILEKRGYGDMAQVVRRHKFIQVDEGFDTWEEKILYYADKRVKHDKVVTLEERLRDGKIRNVPEGRDGEHEKRLDRKNFELEKEIFDAIKTAK